MHPRGRNDVGVERTHVHVLINTIPAFLLGDYGDKKMAIDIDEFEDHRTTMAMMHMTMLS